MDAPNIARLVERQSQQPELLNRYAVYYPSGDHGSGGKTLQLDYSPNFQWTTEARCASLWIYEVRLTWFGKRMSRIQAGKCDRNLETNSSAAPGRLLVGKGAQLQV